MINKDYYLHNKEYCVSVNRSFRFLFSLSRPLFFDLCPPISYFSVLW